MSKVLVDNLYEKVSKSFGNKDNYNTYKRNLDKYMMENAEIYAAIGPYDRPIFSEKNINDLITVTGLNVPDIKETLKKCSYIKPSWVEPNKPQNVAICLALRYFLLQKNNVGVTTTLSYLVVSMYPIMNYRYFQYKPNEAAMTYTINNLSNKFNLKQDKSIWVTLMNMATVCMEHFKKPLVDGTDKAICDFLNSFKTRLNSFLKRIRGEFSEVYEKKLYLGTEFESTEEDNFHEASSDSTAIHNIVNKVVSSLIIHGPDMRLITMSANNCKISVTLLRSYLVQMINDDHISEIETILENLIYLYFNENDTGHPHTMVMVGSNDFFVHCMKVYKKSHTVDDNVTKIKSILDSWMSSLNVYETVRSGTTVNNIRRALYMFFVFSIVKLG